MALDELGCAPRCRRACADVKRLIGLSELQHQLSAQIGHYLDGEEVKVYPVDVFAEILFEKATAYQVLPFLSGAINRVKTGSWDGTAN
jgi:hypothetical protein